MYPSLLLVFNIGIHWEIPWSSHSTLSRYLICRERSDPWIHHFLFFNYPRKWHSLRLSKLENDILSLSLSLSPPPVFWKAIYQGICVSSSESLRNSLKVAPHRYPDLSSYLRLERDNDRRERNSNTVGHLFIAFNSHAAQHHAVMLFHLSLSHGWLSGGTPVGSTAADVSEKRTYWAVRRRLIGPGSSPPTCHARCGRCFPCRPIHVAVHPAMIVPLDYYPEAWRCKCRSRLFMPWLVLISDGESERVYI